MGKDKVLVADFWNEASCGEAMLLNDRSKEGYRIQAEERYRLEPFIKEFANFPSWSGKRVLEIGVGLGADHQQFAKAGALLSGIDLTERAIEHTHTRLSAFDFDSDLSVGDTENLKFDNCSFHLVYSWGVIHHSPDTLGAINEIFRVLKPGGKAKIMIYHKWSMVGLMLWLRYGLFQGRPFEKLSNLYSTKMESPGTKAYSTKEAYKLFSAYDKVKVVTCLTHADLLSSKAGQRNEGRTLTLARMIWPRMLIRKFLSGAGLFLLIDAERPIDTEVRCGGVSDNNTL